MLDAHGADRAVLVGHSWGGFLACAVAAIAPHRVAGMVLVDTLGPVGDGGIPEFDAELMARLPAERLARLQVLDERAPSTAAGDDDMLETVRLIFPAYFADPSAAPELPDFVAASASCSAATFESIDAELGLGRLAAALGSFEGPVEVVYGELSPMPVRVAQDTAALFPGATLRAVPGAGHFPWIERPGSLRSALSSLADRLATGAGAGRETPGHP